MSWISDLSGGLATGGLGAVLGLVGTGITKWAEARDRRDQRKHDLAVLDREIAVARAEAERAAQAAVVAAETDRLKADVGLLQASYQADALPEGVGAETPRVLVWVEAVRRLWRPALTTLLIALTWWLAARVPEPDLHEQIVHGVLFATTASVMWWFGSRATAARPSCVRGNPFAKGIPGLGPVKKR